MKNIFNKQIQLFLFYLNKSCIFALDKFRKQLSLPWQIIHIIFPISWTFLDFFQSLDYLYIEVTDVGFLRHFVFYFYYLFSFSISPKHLWSRWYLLIIQISILYMGDLDNYSIEVYMDGELVEKTITELVQPCEVNIAIF